MWSRQIHRWVSMVLVLMIVSYPLVMKTPGLPHWILHSPLLPLGALLITGVYLFMQPYVAKWRRAVSSTTAAQSLS